MARPEVPTLKTPSIRTLHHAEYPAISPLRPELSKAGKTVLIAGGSTGIGFAIARAFVRAKAARVILLGRREAVVKESAAKLAAEVVDKAATTVVPLVCDVVNLAESAKLWDSLKKDGIFVDVLVLNAATFGEPKPILEAGLASVWGAFEVNVRMLLDFAERFYKQQVGGGEGRRQKVCLISLPCYFIVNLNEG
jgi:short-subunit dehydrogenase